MIEMFGVPPLQTELSVLGILKEEGSLKKASVLFVVIGVDVAFVSTVLVVIPVKKAPSVFGIVRATSFSG